MKGSNSAASSSLENDQSLLWMDILVPPVVLVKCLFVCLFSLLFKAIFGVFYIFKMELKIKRDGKPSAERERKKDARLESDSNSGHHSSQGA